MPNSSDGNLHRSRSAFILAVAVILHTATCEFGDGDARDGKQHRGEHARRRRMLGRPDGCGIWPHFRFKSRHGRCDLHCSPVPWVTRSRWAYGDHPLDLSNDLSNRSMSFNWSFQGCFLICFCARSGMAGQGCKLIALLFLFYFILFAEPNPPV